MDLAFAKARFGDPVDFGPCVFGRNLNLVTVRGYGRLDALACISAPDVYDQIDNPTGTQRALKKKHANQCFEYAREAMDLTPEDEPRAFPEIILNARDTNVVEFYNIEDPSQIYTLSSCSDDPPHVGPIVGMRIRLSQLKFPKPEKRPQISRVDGNHRLYGADADLDRLTSGNGDSPNGEDELDFPHVPFAMFVGLDADQEGRLFRDINAEHEGMETAHLTTLDYRLHTQEEMKSDPKFRPLWLANNLSSEGRAFDGMVFRGGSKTGLRRAGISPSIKINTLRAAIALQLRSSNEANQLEPDELLALLDHYWTAVKNTFPDAWNDRKNFILLQTIGLNGFAEFGGMILDRAINEGKVQVSDFELHLAPSRGVSLKREDYRGIAGAGGAAKIAQMLKQATTPERVNFERARSQLRKDPSIDAKLGISVNLDSVGDAESNSNQQTF